MSKVLETVLCGVKMQNPVIAASGTFGFGSEYAELFDVSKLGGISSKGLTLDGSLGNDGVRIHETHSGIMNSIGLENPGVRHFAEHEANVMRRFRPCISIANLGGHSEYDYVKGAELLNDADIDMIELNISCPNVKEGGMAFGMLPETAALITEKVKGITKYPLMVKLSPNAYDLVSVAKAVQNAGADAISLVNTFLGMAVDTKNKKPVFNNVYAGLSGAAIMPIALRMVHQVCHSVKIPVVGLGGITTADDALQFIMAGAIAVQVGTASFADPNAMLDVISGLEGYCEKNKLENISQIRGIV